MIVSNKFGANLFAILDNFIWLSQINLTTHLHYTSYGPLQSHSIDGYTPPALKWIQSPLVMVNIVYPKLHI